MIRDKRGVAIDDATAAHRLVAAQILQFPGSGLGDRLGRLLTEVEAVTKVIVTLEQGPPFPITNPGRVLADALFQVIRAAGCLLPDHRFSLDQPDPTDHQASNGIVLLGLLTQASGVLAQVASRRAETSDQFDPGTAQPELTEALDLVIARTIALVGHYFLWRELRSAIERKYLMGQDEGFLR